MSELRIQRFTPAATEIVPLIQGDIGRPLANISLDLEHDRLIADLQHVVEEFVTREREVRTSQGKWYRIRMRPYHTSDNRIGGAVLAFANITDEVQLRTARKLGSALDLCPTMVLIVDTDGRVEYANAAFATGIGELFDPARPESLEGLGITPVEKAHWSSSWRTLLGGGTWSGTMHLPDAAGQSGIAATTAVGLTTEGRVASHIAFYFQPAAASAPPSRR